MTYLETACGLAPFILLLCISVGFICYQLGRHRPVVRPSPEQLALIARWDREQRHKASLFYWQIYNAGSRASRALSRN